MKLTELEPYFIRYNGTGWIEHIIEISAAQGINFECPICRGHRVMVSFAGRDVTDEQGSKNREGKPSRWNVSGSSFADLTLTPSIDLTPVCPWHGFVTAGEVT